MQTLRRTISDRVMRSWFVRQTAITAGGSAVAQVVPVLLMPVLTRLYTPSDLGIWALYVAFISFATSGSTLGYSLAIVAARDDEQAADLTVLSALVSVPFSLLASGLLWLLIAKRWLGFGDLDPFVAVLMAVSLILTGIFFSFRYWLLREARFGTIAGATVSQSIWRVVVQVILGAVSAGWSGLIGGEVVGRAAGLRRMFQASWPIIAERSWPPSWQRIRETARSFWKFPAITAPSSLLNSVALALPVPLISTFFGLAPAGQFALASRVLLFPLALVGASVGDVFHSRVSTLARDNPAGAIPLFLKVAGGLFLLGLLPMTVLLIGGDRLWVLILGEDWSIAGQIALAIMPWATMQFAVSPVSRVVTVLDGQELKLVYDCLGILSIVGCIWYGSRAGLSVVDTCAVLGWSQAVVYGVYFLLLIRVVQRGTKPEMERRTDGAMVLE